LIEDSKNYVEALDYVWRQDPDIVRGSSHWSERWLTCPGIPLSTEIRPSAHRELSSRCYQAIRGLLYRKLPTSADFEGAKRD
jgi:hypothetical protein